MKKYSVLILIIIITSIPQMSLAASEDSSADMSAIMARKPEEKKETKTDSRTMFVVETSEEDVSAGLNRIAGEIDLGFAAPQQTYKSSNQKNAVIDRIKDGRPDTSDY